LLNCLLLFTFWQSLERARQQSKRNPVHRNGSGVPEVESLARPYEHPTDNILQIIECYATSTPPADHGEENAWLSLPVPFFARFLRVGSLPMKEMQHRDGGIYQLP
jgi:hypothetical protein